MDETTKACSKCGHTKPLSEYNKDKSRKDGLQNRCRDCRNEDKRLSHAGNPQVKRAYDRRYRAENAEAIAAYQKDYRENNAETLNEKRREKRKDNPEPHRERARKYREAHRHESIDRSAKWRVDNPDRFAESVRLWHQRNPEIRKDINKRHKEKLLSTPKGKLEANVSRGIRRGLVSGSKAGRRTFELLGYTSEELRAHLEKQFLPGMSWDNYGEWHIDHIRPLAAHVYETPDCPDFKLAWALNNLQPLWGVDNMSKGAKLTSTASTTTTSAAAS